MSKTSELKEAILRYMATRASRQLKRHELISAAAFGLGYDESYIFHCAVAAIGQLLQEGAIRRVRKGVYQIVRTKS